MVEKLNIDQYGRSIITERQLCQQLYIDPKVNISNVKLADVSQYNSAIDKLYLDWPKLEALEDLTLTVEQWHEQNQNTWFMPNSYKQLDIAEWLLNQCKNETELQRTGKELLMYADRDLLDLLRYLKYFVDTLRENNIVWGVGRGSSVASFVLYLIGVHKINSISYDLDIEEFIR